MGSAPPDGDRCQFTFTDGRQCRMFRMPKHPDLCFMHWHQEEETLPRRNLGLELLGANDRVLTTADVNRALCRLFRLVAEGRVSARTASTLAYIGQQLTLLVSVMQRETHHGIQARYQRSGDVGLAQEAQEEKLNGRAALAVEEQASDVPHKGNGKCDLSPPGLR